MTHNKHGAARWIALPILVCSLAVLAGEGGLDSDTAVSALTLDTTEPTCDSGDPARGECAVAPAVSHAAMGASEKVEHAVDTMTQARQLNKEADGFVDDSSETNSLNTGYVGGQTRLGIGIDSEFKGKADLSHVFTESEDSATTVQGYVGFDPKAGKDKTVVDSKGVSTTVKDDKEKLSAAGVKLNHHWVSKDASGQVSHVNKVFGAYDQNQTKDKKITVGYGQETEGQFWSGHVSKGLSDKRATGTVTDEKGASVNVFEKAYDYGVGGRVGTYLPEQQMRVQGGMDYEWGTEVADNEKKARQVTLTGGVEKFFPDSPHSINANVDVYKKSGGYETTESKTEVRGGVGYRYDIGSAAGIWQPDQQYKRVRVEIPGEEVKQTPKIERKLVKHTMELEADTFFKVNSAILTPEAKERLQAVIAQIRASGHEGNIRIVGNTCDVGTTAKNQTLSEKRANAVRTFLISCGFNADELLAEGLGETQPKYPNTDAERHKNRRVDIEYVTYQTKYKDEVVEQGGTTHTDPKVVWRKELIPSPPLWVRQALHNTADHKNRVDTYQTTKDSEKTGGTTGGEPIANADTGYSVQSCKGQSLTLNVLDNDSGSGIRINAPSAEIKTTNGTVKPSSDGLTLIYTPTEGATGKDTFTYNIIDENKVTSKDATISVNVTDCGNGLIATNNEYPVEQGKTLSLGILVDDTPSEGVGIVIEKAPIRGTATVQDGYIDYTAPTNYTGELTFTYYITKDGQRSNTATVTIDVVAPTNLPPIVNDTPASVQKDGTSVLDPLANATDPTGEALTLVSFQSTSANGGTITKGTDGKLTYTAPKNFTGTDTFTYIIRDAYGNEVEGTARITVEGTACPAINLSGDTISFAYSNEPAVLSPYDVLANDTGSNLQLIGLGDSLSSKLTTEAGTAEIINGKIEFFPSAESCAPTTFTYTVEDSCKVRSTITVTVDVK